jgi:hypothetical protein
MSVDRSRLGCALPDAPVAARSKHSTALRGMVAGAALLGGILGSTGASLSAQFPPPARPPKMAAEPSKSPEGAAVKLPSARSILDKHLAAIGGRQAVLSHTSTRATGTISMPAAGVTGAVEIYGAQPNRTLLKVSLDGVGEILEGFDGTHGWSSSPMTGPMLLEGRQLDEKRFDSEFHGELRSDNRYVSMTTLEQVDFEGRPCYKIRLVRKSGGEDLEFYDVATGLKAGSTTTRETQMGTVTGTAAESNYKKFGNLLQPTMVKSQIGGLQQVMTITAVDYDNVPASVFELPAGIKALLK